MTLPTVRMAEVAGVGVPHDRAGGGWDSLTI
jgi:hypothetical protein